MDKMNPSEGIKNRNIIFKREGEVITSTITQWPTTSHQTTASRSADQKGQTHGYCLLYTNKNLQMTIGKDHPYVEDMTISSSSDEWNRYAGHVGNDKLRKVVGEAKEQSAFFQTVAKA